MKKLLYRFLWYIIQNYGCKHEDSSIFTYDDNIPRLGCNDCGKDFGEIPI